MVMYLDKAVQQFDSSNVSDYVLSNPIENYSV